MKLLLLSAAALLFAFGGLAMKYSAGMTRLSWSVVFLLLFVAGASCQALAMRASEMGPVYVFVLGLEAIAAMGISVVILGESINAARIGAVLLIVGGIALLNR